MADRRAAPARRIVRRARSPSCREGCRRAETRTRPRHHEFRSQHTPVGDAGPRRRSRHGRAAGRARKSRQGERGGSRMAVSWPPDRGHARRLGELVARGSASRRSAEAALSRCLGAERLSVAAPKIDVVDTVGAGDSFMSALLSAMDRDGALGRQDGPPSRRASAGLARLRREGVCDHLHAKGVRPADPGRGRRLSRVEPIVDPTIIAARLPDR